MKRFFSKKYVILTVLSLLLIVFGVFYSVQINSVPYVSFDNTKIAYSDVNWINSNPYERSTNYHIHAFAFMESDLLDYQKTKNKIYKTEKKQTKPSCFFERKDLSS